MASNNRAIKEALTAARNPGTSEAPMTLAAIRAQLQGGSGGGLRGLSVADPGLSADSDEDPGLLESAGRGALQGVSFGFADEISGVLRSAFGPKTYTQARDEARARDKAAKEAHPIGFGLSEVLASVGTGVGTAGLAAKAAVKGT